MLLHMSMSALSCTEGSLHFCPVYVPVLLLIGASKDRGPMPHSVPQVLHGAASWPSSWCTSVMQLRLTSCGKPQEASLSCIYLGPCRRCPA